MACIDPAYYKFSLPILKAPIITPADETADLDRLALPSSLLALSPHCVTQRSSSAERRAVWQLADYFRREFQFDFVPYGDHGRESDASARAYLWLRDTEPSRTVAKAAYGACCFRWRVLSNGSAGWLLSWIWFHPFERGKGHLTSVWPFFQARFGDFAVELPLSHAMEAFLHKMRDASGSEG